ncbi:4'-phosphopantetheinyl transferase [Ectocarpus siliculosus]|uniref:4'-phosphopantetheinyl transferase n=1 Tax=Ectocarpus siliculosus TaxID=2880 RepID=D7FQQ5_ECTSI|nr:4'-phosphopantetheinyl transferase [Ectocarpus siliculosus]|eukprot:CBJ49162.1 4'-phosphopantetheinyl transferase [Ectocarpus siliculosus]
MERKVALHRWATLAYVILLLCESPALSMAFCVHHSRYLRSASYARSFESARLAAATSTPPRRKGMRRGRATSMLHSDACGGSTSASSSQVQLSQLPTAMDRILPFGRCVGVALPPTLTDDVMTAAGEELLPKEMAYCLGLPRALQLGFLGGRLAIRRALNGMEDVSAAASSQAILHNQDGAPVLPEGVSASISHKQHLAVALVQSGCEGHLGIDIELPAVQRRLDLRRRVLTPRECDSLGGVDGMSDQEEVLLRFSMKEAVYKAAHPFLHRPLGFKDVEVQPVRGGGCEVRTTTRGAWGGLRLSAGWMFFPDVLGQPLFLSYCKAVDGGVSSSSSRRRSTSVSSSGGQGR